MRNANIAIHPAFTIGTVNARMFGSFVEHLGRGVYGGIYDPAHELSDHNGFRQDVIELVRELGVTTVRYPGGNFVSAYDWRDGIGPVEHRPRRLDPAWHSIETNAFGTDEFLRWCAQANVEPMMAVNLGTSDIRSALQLLEYVNHPADTTLSQQRATNGSPQPYGVKLWCLGNEMDGPWQIGHLTADEYGRLAARTGAAMKAIDEDVQLIVCGSSNDRMPTFGQWEHEVLTHTIDVTDYISCHQYFRNDGNLPRFLASGVAMDRFIETVAATIIQVGAATGSTSDIGISFDEWNVWDWEAHDALSKNLSWETAPPLLEDRYTVADAVVVGDMLISMLNHADTVRAASLAQLVNVIGPIVAEPHGPAWRQTTFYPFAQARRAAGSTALRTAVTSPTYESDGNHIPLLSAACTWNRGNDVLNLFMVNRDTQNEMTVTVDLSSFSIVESASATVLHDPDPTTANSASQPNRVSPETLHIDVATLAGRGQVSLNLPPVAWASIDIKVHS